MNNQKTKHTPGPWYAIDECVFAKIPTVDGTPVQPMIASCSKFTTSQHANARLIAAAPELLEALGRIVGISTDTDASKQDRLEYIETIAKMAIAQATGGEK